MWTLLVFLLRKIMDYVKIKQVKIHIVFVANVDWAEFALTEVTPKNYGRIYLMLLKGLLCMADMSPTFWY